MIHDKSRLLPAARRADPVPCRPGNGEYAVAVKIWMAIIALLLSALLFRAAPAMAEADFQQGLWEIQTRTELVGISPNKAAPVTEKHCLKDESQVPQILQKDRSCRTTNTKTEGGSVSWRMKCEAGEGSMEGSGRMTWRGGRFAGTIRLTLRRPEAGPLKIRQHVSGRRLGDCP